MKKASKILGRLIERLMIHEIPMRSGAVAFAALFAVGPLILLLLALISSFNLDLREELIVQIERLFGDNGADLLIHIIGEKASIGWSSVAVLVVSSGAIFGQIRETLRKIFGRDAVPQETSILLEVKAFFKSRFFSFLVVLAFIVLCFASLLLSSILSFVLVGGHRLLGGILDDGVTFLAFGVLFSLLIYYSSARKVPWITSLIGGFFTSFLFTLGKRGISLYLAQTEIDNLYGAAGPLAGLLVWIYYSSLIFFIGAELAAVLPQRRI